MHIYIEEIQVYMCMKIDMVYIHIFHHVPEITRGNEESFMLVWPFSVLLNK
jgi:hypothetical protein